MKTIEEVRDWHREQAHIARNSIARFIGDTGWKAFAKEHDEMADAIDLCLNKESTHEHF